MADVMPTIRPQIEKLWDGQVEVWRLDASHSYDWSPKDIQTQTDLFDPQIKRQFDRLATVSRAGHVNTVWAPSVKDFTARMSSHREFCSRISGEITIMRGASADAFRVPEKQAGFIASADCPTIVVRGACKRVVMAHGGRESVIRRGQKRANKSVVEEVVNHFRRNKSPVENLNVFLTTGIHPLNFQHPMDQKRNRELAQEINPLGESVFFGDPDNGYLNLFEVIRRQFELEGVNPEKIRDDSGQIDTFSDKETDGSFRWHSARRGALQNDTEARCKRNGILVMNRD